MSFGGKYAWNYPALEVKLLEVKPALEVKLVSYRPLNFLCFALFAFAGEFIISKFVNGYLAFNYRDIHLNLSYHI